jgi:hypothetical protein
VFWNEIIRRGGRQVSGRGRTVKGDKSGVLNRDQKREVSGRGRIVTTIYYTNVFIVVIAGLA